jgi:hypothetical protein
MDPDESTAERSGPASGAAGGDRTEVGLTFSPDLTASTPAGSAPAGPEPSPRAPHESPDRSPGGTVGSSWGSRVAPSVPGTETPVGWPNVADYWPDAPQRMGPPADVHEDPAAAPTRIAASWQQGPARPAFDEFPGPVPARRERGAALGQPAQRDARAAGAPSAQREPRAAAALAGATGQQPAVRAAVLGRPADLLTSRRGWAAMFGPAADPETPPRGGRVLAGAGLAVLVLLGGGVVAYRKMAGESRLAGPPPVVSVAPPPPSATASGAMGPAVVLPQQSPSKRTAVTSKPAQRPKSGTFFLVDDVSDLTIRTSRLDQGVVKVDGNEARPRTTVDGGDVRLRLDRGGRRADIDVQLDSRVRWAIRLGGGARTMTLDLGAGDVRSVTFDGGAARIDLTLPRLGGTLPIAMNGGVNQWRIETQGRVKVQVVARKGAGKVVLYGRDRGGMRRGEQVSADGGSGIDVDAGAGFGSLTVVGD